MTKKELIKTINNLCGKDRISFYRRVAVHELWNGRGWTKQYACAISKNKYYIHFPAYCMGYDMGETVAYPLTDLDSIKLEALYKQTKLEVSRR